MDIEKIRAETIGCRGRVHLNNAGASLQPREVTTAVSEFLELEASQGGYEAQNLVDETLSSFYSEFARLIHSDPSEIAYVENATRGYDLVVYGIDWQPGDNVVCCASEYGSNFIALLHLRERFGIEIKVAPVTGNLKNDLEKLESLIDDRTRLISLVHIPSVSGLISPAKHVGEIAKRKKVLYLLDACQSLGHLDIDVQEIQCDVLCASGRKYMRGPRGSGVLFVARGIMDQIDPAFLDMRGATWDGDHSFTRRSDAKLFECWECNVAAKIGLAKAARYCNDLGMKSIEKRVLNLGYYLREKLRSLSRVEVMEYAGENSGIVTLSCHENTEALKEKLNKKGFNTSVAYNTSGRFLYQDKCKTALRASVHYYNTEEEIDRFADAMKSLLSP